MLVLFALLVAGCGGSSNVQVSSSGSPSTGVSTGGSVSVQGTSVLGTLIAIGVISALAYESERQYGGYGLRYRANPFLAIQSDATRPAPPMDGSRKVNEQDCSKPIEDWSANLKCR
ncbi:MAG: hypothetical protein ACREVG_19965 [Burkholderiales bacterium]